MILFLSLVFAYKSHRMKLCDSEPPRYIKVPSTSPFAANQTFKDAFIDFNVNQSYKYKKSFFFLNLPKFTICSSPDAKSIFYTDANTENCNNFILVPLNYEGCYKITFGDNMCLAMRQKDSQLTAEVCQKGKKSNNSSLNLQKKPVIQAPNQHF
ncbi:hypothetical protein EDEG_02158 [Edhazardia aedis USNM 41457]|uniref:Uncharacterized protein n=1 Tax=Edhazardia aedis (strain USNM 41457) TaxID=1003232 RepID=J9DQ82_EDHAE|nr:hypothetical protein EDEG_02158 [Edhazardia aedis USNM 41457]|eukprot:EJW03502.1 hypothetical protein EDEG_02158 [Edhazardia aedis USNM 41457]